MPRELTEDVWLLELPFVNAYLVADDVLVLVDAGYPRSGRRLRTEIESAGFDPATVDRVLLTHFDLDHVGGLGALPGTQDIYAGVADAPLVSGARVPRVTGVKGGLQRLSARFVRPPTSPVTGVADGDEIGSFTAIHSPGHTAGHVVYASAARNVAFVGDLVMSDGDSLSPPPWFLNEDTARVRDSIDRVASRLPPVDVVAPGHGEPLAAAAFRTLANA
ncbi:MAG: MBL fold metallo-hydrolase [Halodesulfurarchaeum sp.]